MTNMWNRIRYALFRRKQRQQAARDVRFPVYDAVRRILVVYDSDIMEKNADIRQIVQRLTENNKQVKTLGYVARKDVQSPNLPQSRMIGSRDHNFLHILNKNIVADLQQEDYDLLLDLTEEPCLPLHYVAMLAHCRFRAGRHIVDGLHDLDIEMPAADNHLPLFEQIMHYLQTIKSNDNTR